MESSDGQFPESRLCGTWPTLPVGLSDLQVHVLLDTDRIAPSDLRSKRGEGELRIPLGD
jgi:hypothetical protein